MRIFLLKTFYCLFMLSLACTFSIAQADNSSNTIFDHFYSEELLEVSIYTDFEQLEEMRKTNEYQAAAFNFVKDGVESKWGIKLRTRGKFRRRICNQPPLKLNFNKTDLEEAGLERDDELKLVNQCISGYEGKDYVFREYLVYKLFNIISPQSFRAQMVKLEYYCTASGDREKGWGFILEDKNTLERRLEMGKCDECYGRVREDFDEQSLMRATLFQYMISNTDYSLNQSRNLELFLDETSGKIFVAPYDFDFSGVVNASYAVPNVDYKQTSMRDRIFLGHSTDAQLQETIEYFIAKKPEIMNCIKEAKYLARSSRKDIEDYIEAFYKSLEKGIVRPQ